MTDTGKRGQEPPRRRAIACGLAVALVLVYGPCARADAPPWAQEASAPTRNQVAYRFPPGLKDGRCRPDMFDKAAIQGLQGAIAASRRPSALRGSRAGDLAETAVGTLMAAIGEKRPSRRMARQIEICFSQSFEHAPDRMTIAWTDIGHAVHFSVMPIRTLQTSDGRYCREYTAQATLNGHAADVYGTACRQSSGRWFLID